jgi:hypothetical protein
MAAQNFELEPNETLRLGSWHTKQKQKKYLIKKNIHMYNL